MIVRKKDDIYVWEDITEGDIGYTLTIRNAC